MYSLRDFKNYIIQKYLLHKITDTDEDMVVKIPISIILKYSPDKISKVITDLKKYNIHIEYRYDNFYISIGEKPQRYLNLAS